MRYAVIDLETTGSKPLNDRIIEIAIVIVEDGKILKTFESLVNPEKTISQFIERFTGISNQMVSTAPKFYEIAKDVIEWTQGCVFVAHNVGFDYSFLKATFKSLGYDYRRKTLCTVRLSRKIIKGQASYSLGKLCKSLEIPLHNRHRAGGDATATALLLQLLCQLDDSRVQRSIVQDEIRKVSLPSKISHEDIAILPEEAGVYYFLDKEDQIIYLGKSKHIRTRVLSHLQTYHKSRKQGEIKKKIAKIKYTLTGNELIALLLESSEIKRIQPKYNRAQRKTRLPYGVYAYEDQNGYINLKVKKIDPEEMPAFFADSFQNGRKLLLKLMEKHQLCSRLCHIYTHSGACFDYQIKKCHGACMGEESPQDYNLRAQKVISHLSTFDQPNFLIIEKGRDDQERGIVSVQNGKYMGFAYAPLELIEDQNIKETLDLIQPYQDNRDTQRIIRSHLKNTEANLWFYEI